MDSLNTNAAVVIESISVIIRQELASLSSEHWAPRFASDQMDSELSFRRERINRLRELRHEFENIMYGLQREDV